MIYCKQVEPEYQESRLFDEDDMEPEYICVTGNRDYISRTSPLFDRVYRVLQSGELCEALDDLKIGGFYSAWYKNATEAINDWLEPEKPRYSTGDIHALKELVKAYNECSSREENAILCKVLSVVCGYKWDWRQITGSCQGDWNEVFYPVKDWTEEALTAFEIMYFNEGSEWIIHDEESAPEGPEDITGYSVYCTARNEEGIKQELAEAAGVKPEEIIMYAFEGYTRNTVYKAV